MLRERQKQARRQAILDAAEALIRETGATDFTMLAVAERAMVSPTTLYNLFGTKAAILYKLLNDSTDKILTRSGAFVTESDPFRRTMTAINAAIDVFVADPAFHRPLNHYLLGVRDSINRPAFTSKTEAFWRPVLKGLDERSPLVEELGLEQLTKQLTAVFVGFLDPWVLGEISEKTFRRSILTGIALILTAFAGPAGKRYLRGYITPPRKVASRTRQ
jgi:AcrR family transcriptional regulator